MQNFIIKKLFSSQFNFQKEWNCKHKFERHYEIWEFSFLLYIHSVHIPPPPLSPNSIAIFTYGLFGTPE